MRVYTYIRTRIRLFISHVIAGKMVIDIDKIFVGSIRAVFLGSHMNEGSVDAVEDSDKACTDVVSRFPTCLSRERPPVVHCVRRQASSV